MAFHVACPITCRKICYCTLGLPGLKKEGKNAFLEEVGRIEEFLKDPWRRRSNDGLTVQVKVPKVVAVDLPPPPRPEFKNFQPQQKELVVAEVVQGKIEDGGGGGGGGGELDELALANVSAQSKRLALQKKAAATSEMVEDLVRKFEAGDLGGDMVDLAGEEQGQLNVKMMCRLCLSGEIDGTERARRMLPCKSCGKKYHRSCLKRWSQNRDLFHWSSWACPACRICEVCCRTGDPNKFMFCRRCDAAYHCYCQHPPHKNVSHGPYLCPKHTRCHSCGSNVPGNGSSLRWFLGYTCCDACGRLFVKGNYCPVCLKVYRDSESTPMVCCDICQRWVHCQCDDISNERYMEFQSDGNLQYACPTCRGECCQVRNPEEAVLELWRRRDEADRDLIASLREAAGLPTQDEIFSITPFSDDEDDGPAVSKNEHGRSIKLTLKSLLEKSPKKNEHGKKSSNKKSGKKKVQQSSITGQSEAPQDIEGDRDEELPLFQTSEPENLTAVQKHKSVDEVVNNNGVRTSSRMVRVKSYTPHGEDFVSDSGTDMNITKSSKGPKLVIHLGSRNINSSNPPKADHTHQAKGSKSKIKIRKSNPDVTDTSGMFGSVSTPTGHALTAEVDGENQVRPSRGGKRSFLEYAEGRPDVSGALDDVNGNNPAASNLVSKDSRPLLKLKLKKPHQENQISWIYAKDDEMSLPKGQRSKRKRPSSLREGAASALGVQDSGMDEIMDANWILQKLGKDAVGKRVEVHQPTDNSWHRGTVAEVFEGTSSVSVAMDDGKPKDLELGKQGVRFVSQKQRR